MPRQENDPPVPESRDSAANGQAPGGPWYVFVRYADGGEVYLAGGLDDVRRYTTDLQRAQWFRQLADAEAMRDTIRRARSFPPFSAVVGTRQVQP